MRRNLPWIGIACQVLAVGVAVTSALWERRARQVPPMALPIAAE